MPLEPSLLTKLNLAKANSLAQNKKRSCTAPPENTNSEILEELTGKFRSQTAEGKGDTVKNGHEQALERMAEKQALEDFRIKRTYLPRLIPPPSKHSPSKIVLNKISQRRKKSTTTLSSDKTKKDKTPEKNSKIKKVSALEPIVGSCTKDFPPNDEYMGMHLTPTKTPANTSKESKIKRKGRSAKTIKKTNNNPKEPLKISEEAGKPANDANFKEAQAEQGISEGESKQDDDKTIGDTQMVLFNKFKKVPPKQNLALIMTNNLIPAKTNVAKVISLNLLQHVQ